MNGQGGLNLGHLTQHLKFLSAVKSSKFRIPCSVFSLALLIGSSHGKPSLLHKINLFGKKNLRPFAGKTGKFGFGSVIGWRPKQ